MSTRQELAPQDITNTAYNTISEQQLKSDLNMTGNGGKQTIFISTGFRRSNMVTAKPGKTEFWRGTKIL